MKIGNFIRKRHKLLKVAVSTPLGNIGEGTGFGPFNFGNVGSPLTVVAKVASTVIGVITLVAGIYFIFQFLIGAFGWLTSSGDKTRLQKAQDRLTHALIGLVIVVATYAIVEIVQTITGLDLLLKSPGNLENILKLGG